MTAPVSQRIRCIVSGHDWRRAIAPRDGYYLRCRRCWSNRPVDESPERDATQWVQGPAPDHTPATPA